MITATEAVVPGGFVPLAHYHPTSTPPVLRMEINDGDDEEDDEDLEDDDDFEDDDEDLEDDEEDLEDDEDDDDLEDDVVDEDAHRSLNELP